MARSRWSPPAAGGSPRLAGVTPPLRRRQGAGVSDAILLAGTAPVIETAAMPQSSSANMVGGPGGERPGLPLILLAAGKSTRMRGRDKLMEDVDGQPLIRRQAQAALDAGLIAFVALPDAYHPRAQALGGLLHQPLFLPGSVEGLGGTIRDAVAALPACPSFLILAADLPGITAADLRAMSEAEMGETLVLVATDARGNYGHPIRFDARLRPAFAALKGDEGARAVVRATRQRRPLPLPGDHATRDLDTPEDWAEWRAATPR